MLNKKLSYILAALLLLVPLAAYVFFNGVSGVVGGKVPFIVLGLLLLIPPILTLVVGSMYSTPRLPKDVSWLWIAFLGCWAFVCSNIVILASRQSTMQYGTILTALDFVGFDVSRNYNAVAGLEAPAVLLTSVVAVALLLFIPAYAHVDKRRRAQLAHPAEATSQNR